MQVEPKAAGAETSEHVTPSARGHVFSCVICSERLALLRLHYLNCRVRVFFTKLSCRFSAVREKGNPWERKPVELGEARGHTAPCTARPLAGTLQFPAAPGDSEQGQVWLPTASEGGRLCVQNSRVRIGA